MKKGNPHHHQLWMIGIFFKSFSKKVNSENFIKEFKHNSINRVIKIKIWQWETRKGHGWYWRNIKMSVARAGPRRERCGDLQIRTEAGARSWATAWLLHEPGKQCSSNFALWAPHLLHPSSSLWITPHIQHSVNGTNLYGEFSMQN